MYPEEACIKVFCTEVLVYYIYTQEYIYTHTRIQNIYYAYTVSVPKVLSSQLISVASQEAAQMY